jgi:Tfp pilus assembly protein PilN
MRNAPGASINLASAPFTAERARTAAVAVACGVLTLSLLTLVGLILHERQQASALRTVISRERATFNSLQQQQTKLTGVLAKPDNADVFSKSVFVNELISRRAVSWTRVFEDLQPVLPNDMRLVSVRLPQVPPSETSASNHLQLDMVVGSEHQGSVVDLLKRLGTSPLFGAARVVNQQPPMQNDPLYRYRVSVAYVQKL